MQIFVLLPAYNESENLLPLLEKFIHLKTKTGFEEPLTIVLVDDGSQDSTSETALNFKDRLDLVLIRHEKNLGFPHALRTGLNKILEVQRSRAPHPDDSLVVMDADNSHEPVLIANMAKKIMEGQDVVIGSRYVPGASETGVSVVRKFLSRACGWILRRAFHLGEIQDYTSSYRMIRISCLKVLSEKTAGQFFKENSFVCAFEFLFNLYGLKGRFCEVPLQLHYDLKKGPSKMNVGKTILGYFRIIVRLKIRN